VNGGWETVAVPLKFYAKARWVRFRSPGLRDYGNPTILVPVEKASNNRE